MFKFFTILLVFSFLYCKTEAFCNIAEGIMIPNQYSLVGQSANGFCSDWLVGPITSTKMILITIDTHTIDCANGDTFVATASDRATVIFNFCKPIPNQNAFIFLEERYLFLSLSTKSFRKITVNIRYLVGEPTVVTSTSKPITISTASTAATTVNLSTIGIVTTTATIATVATKLTAAASTVAATGITFGTLSTAPTGITTIVQTASTFATFSTLSTASTTGSQTNPTVITTTRITNPTVITTTIAGSTTTISSSSCGVSFFKANITSRIIGGSEAVAHSWPWQVYMTDGLFDDEFKCGGSLINNNWIVTAAHCVDTVKLQQSLKIYLGLHDRVNKSANSVFRTPNRIILHPNYQGEPTLWEHDIALIKLSAPVTYTNEIKPICLPTQGNNKAVLNANGVITGWGRTKGFGSDQVLVQTTVNINPISNCSATSDNMLCAGSIGLFWQQGSCIGDSGGPLSVLENNVYYLGGIISTGDFACKPPSIYTKVSNYITWISSTIATN